MPALWRDHSERLRVERSARGVQLPKPQPPDVIVEQVARLLGEKKSQVA
jgi:hypothetical protein